MFLQKSKLKKAVKFLSLMESNEFTAAVNFLCNIFHHLNQLNLELQGRDKTLNLWRDLMLFKESSHSSLLICVQAKCSTSPR